ncbi:MAG TPA: hypothetical protein DEF45_06600 [Rhodopirellula sp.]|nr:MAG: hypothetical protein CBD74_08395 [Saprospirales bacterium TMED214]HBV62676.1 hypothetical protein [Rhodopirellula sp.]
MANSFCEFGTFKPTANDKTKFSRLAGSLAGIYLANEAGQFLIPTRIIAILHCPNHRASSRTADHRQIIQLFKKASIHLPQGTGKIDSSVQHALRCRLDHSRDSSH